MSEHEFLKHLKENHDKQKKIGERLKEAEPSEREALRQKFFMELYPHVLGEETSIFPRLIKSDHEEAVEDAHEALQEHHVAKLLLRELMEMQTDSPEFKAKAAVLDELNRHHIEEEEVGIFDHLKKLCDDKEMTALFEVYEKAEEKAKKRAKTK